MSQFPVTSCHKSVNALQVFGPQETEMLSSKPTPMSPGKRLNTLVLPALLRAAAWPSLHSAEVWGFPSQCSIVCRIALYEHISPQALPDMHAALLSSLGSHWPRLGPLWPPSAVPGSSLLSSPSSYAPCHSQSHRALVTDALCQCPSGVFGFYCLLLSAVPCTVTVECLLSHLTHSRCSSVSGRANAGAL